ncbi:unnamed protein product [Ixodes persulcatus]
MARRQDRSAGWKALRSLSSRRATHGLPEKFSAIGPSLRIGETDTATPRHSTLLRLEHATSTIAKQSCSTWAGSSNGPSTTSEANTVKRGTPRVLPPILDTPNVNTSLPNVYTGAASTPRPACNRGRDGEPTTGLPLPAAQGIGPLSGRGVGDKRVRNKSRCGEKRRRRRRRSRRLTDVVGFLNLQGARREHKWEELFRELEAEGMTLSGRDAPT